MAKKRVCLDAGHYGLYNEGAVSGYWESKIVWDLTNKLKAELEKYGIEVVLTRTNQAQDKDLFDRGYMSKGCDYFISMHSNASTSSATNYVLAIELAKDDSMNLDEKSHALATKMAQAVSECMKYPYVITTKKADWDRDGNSKMDDEWYGVLQGCKKAGTAGIILEHSFHTNPEVCYWLMIESNRTKLAQAEAKALADLLGVSLKTDKPEDAKYRKSEWTGTYETKIEARCRIGAGVDKKVLVKVPKGTKVQCYGYYNKSKAGNIWYLVDFTYKKKKYTGYMTKLFLKKV